MTEITGEPVVVATGSAAKQFSGIIRLNQTGLEIWNGLAEGLDPDSIAARIVERYENVDLETAKKAVLEAIEKLKSKGVIVE